MSALIVLLALFSDGAPAGLWIPPTGYQVWVPKHSNNYTDIYNWECPFVPLGPQYNVCYGEHLDNLPNGSLVILDQPVVLGDLKIFNDYPVTFQGTMTADEIWGPGNITVKGSLTARNINLNTLTIGSPGSDVPEPSGWRCILGAIPLAGVFWLALKRRKKEFLLKR
jgi:hypothetical protein